MATKEGERAYAVDHVRAVEVLHFRPLRDAEAEVKPSDARDSAAAHSSRATRSLLPCSTIKGRGAIIAAIPA